MDKRHRAHRAVAGLVLGLVGLVLADGALAADVGGGAKPPKAGTGRTVVLDTTALWRMYNTLKPPVIGHEDGPSPVLYGPKFLDTETAPPPADWTAPGFDDSGWTRAVALRACKTPYLWRLCLRGKFEVTDPAGVHDLRLTVGYHGGAIVYVNGKEVKRANVPADVPVEKTLADPYPVEAFVTPEGALLTKRNATGPEMQRRLELRERLLPDVEIPSSLLRTGTNVVAVELVRAPYDRIQEGKKVPDHSGKQQISLQWNTCEIRRVQLSAASAEGLVPNATRPAGLQVWNSDMALSDFDLDLGDRTEPLRPIRIVAARNGTFSGKVVVGSDKPLRGLRAVPSDLTCGDATIPAAAIRVRYGLPWGAEDLVIPYTEQVRPYPRAVNVFGELVDSPPEEVPVYAKTRDADTRYTVHTPGQPDPVYGAVAPVWFTVAVPAGAKPGKYVGTARIEAAGQSAVAVPLEVQVEDWAIPDTQDYKTWVDLIEVPDTLTLEYGMTPWSAEHWKMIDQAFKYIGEGGSRMVYLPLIAETNLGHEQSMVRWIKKADGTYDHDFTILDRYLDAAVQNMGKPKIVVLWVWEIYLIEKEMYQGKDHLHLADAIAAREAMRGTGPRVTVLDPATGKTGTVALPPYKDPAAKALWQPVIAGVRERLKARGLDKSVMFGVCNDTRPTKTEVQFFDDLLPGTPWASQAHGGFSDRSLVGDVAKCGYQARVWNVQFARDQSLHGWRNPMLLTYYDRDRDLAPKAPSFWAHMGEMCITGDQRGIGRLGADYWPCLKDKNGARKGGYPWSRYMQSSWRNLDLYSYVLAPGPQGPVATPQFERLREGIQHCEARIFLESALLDKSLREKLGEELAGRVQAVLDERQTAMARSMSSLQLTDPSYIGNWRAGTEVAGHIWWSGSDWQDRSARLFAAAAEAARRLKG